MAERNDSGDFVKGLLVIGMVLYHVTSAFSERNIMRELLDHGFLNFISGSWVYISGMLIAVYYQKNFDHDPLAVTQRLLIRGIKLLSIFLFLNWVVSQVEIPEPRPEFDVNFVRHLLVEGDSKASFEILVGISYILLLAPLLLYLGNVGIMLVLGLLILMMFLQARGIYVAINMQTIAWGVGGYLAGQLLRFFSIQTVLRSERRMVVALIASMLVVTAYYFAVIFFNHNKDRTLIFLFGITGILAAFYLSHHWFRRLPFLDRSVRLLGGFPLVSYIWQMGLIWLLVVLESYFSFRFSYMAYMSLVLLLLWASVLLLRQLIRRGGVIYHLYRAVFM